MNSGEICHHAKIFMGAGEEKIAEMIQQEQGAAGASWAGTSYDRNKPGRSKPGQEQARQEQSKQEQSKQEQARQERARQEQAGQEQPRQVRCWIKQDCFGKLAPMEILQTGEKPKNF